jgi:DNA-binding NtrC family response regulator
VAGTVLVFEKRPRIVPELQRQFLNRGVRVRACSSLADLWIAAQETPLSVLVLDLDAATAEVLQFLGRAVSFRAGWHLVVVASTDTAELEWSVRELGVLQFVREFNAGTNLGRLCGALLAADVGQH